VEGDSLCHLDVRSHNLCFRADGGAVLVDWDCAGIGNPEFDLAFWLPSLHLEGDPRPEAVADCAPGMVAIVAGYQTHGDRIARRYRASAADENQEHDNDAGRPPDCAFDDPPEMEARTPPGWTVRPMPWPRSAKSSPPAGGQLWQPIPARHDELSQLLKGEAGHSTSRSVASRSAAPSTVSGCSASAAAATSET
jgi:hypothetical protein